jgi:hypothetical protein
LPLTAPGVRRAGDVDVDAAHHSPGRKIEAVGGVLSVLGLGLLAFALIEGRNYGW